MVCGYINSGELMKIDIYSKNGKYLCTTTKYTTPSKAVNAIEGEVALKDCVKVAGSKYKITFVDCPLKGKKHEIQ